MGTEFSITINSGELAKGLRPSKRVPRNSRYLVTCVGAVGRDGTLQVIDQLTSIDTSSLPGLSFPYPQIFVFTNVIIVCTPGSIHELVGGTLVCKLGVWPIDYTALWGTSPWGAFPWPGGPSLPFGSTWTAVDFFDYVYLSNGVVSVVRDPTSHEYSIITTLPTASAICNFNGQVLIGAPDVTIPGASLTIKADPIILTTTQLGSYT